MKFILSFLLSFCLLSAQASRCWVPSFYTISGQAIYGYEDVYNVRTDAGLTFTNNTANVDNAKWVQMRDACVGIKPMYIPPYTLLNMTQPGNSLSAGLIVKAQGIGMYGGFVINSSFSGGKTGTTAPDVNDNVFINIGQSNVFFEGVYFSGNIYVSGQAKHILAFCKNNSMGADNQTQVRNLQYINCDFRDIWGDCIRNGDATNPNGIHMIDGMTVDHCNFRNIGNPTKPYVVQPGAPDFDFSYGVNLNSTTGTFLGTYNTFTNIAGTCFRSLNNNGTTLATQKKLGNWKIIGNTAKNVNCFFTSFGPSFVNSISWEDNTVINPTGEFAFSVTGDNMHSVGNMVYGYQGCRIPYEYYATNSTFFDNWLNYTGDMPDDSDRIQGFSYSRTVKPNYPTVAMLTSSLVINGLANNTYKIKGGYDRSLGVSQYCPDGLYGYQITSGEGFNFDGTEIYDANGYEWFGQVNNGAQRVKINSNCVVRSSYQQYGSVVEIHNTLNKLGWIIDRFYVDLTGSPEAPFYMSNGKKVYTAGLVSTAQLQGSINTNSFLFGYKKFTSSFWGLLNTGQYQTRTGNALEQSLSSSY